MTAEILVVIVVSNIASFVFGVLFGRKNKQKVENVIDTTKIIKKRL